MRYKGINDRYTLLETDPTCDVFIYKGEPKSGWGKSTRPGRDLQEYFRLEIGNKRYFDHLFRAYKVRGDFIEKRTHTVTYTNNSGEEVKKQQSFLYVDHLNIFCAYEIDEKTFTSDLVIVQGNKIIQRCNRETIYQEGEKQENWTGTRWGVKSCDHPCQAPQDDPFAPCPLKCERQGNFYFYLLEFDILGLAPVCRIQTHSFEDIIRVPKALLRLEAEFGSIRDSPKVYQYKYKKNIPLILIRSEVPILRPQLKTEHVQGKKIYKRTGKKSNDTTWALTLNMPTDYVRAFYDDQLIDYIQESGGRAAKALYQSVYGDAIDVDAVELTEPAELPQQEQALIEASWEPTPDDKATMNQLYREYGWNKDTFVQLTQELFGITNPQDLNNLYQPQWLKLMEELKKRPVPLNRSQA